MTTAEKHFNELESIDYWQALNRKSLLRFFLLQQLSKAPLHGYEIANRIALCCDARPTDAMIYPMLKELEQGKFVSFEPLVINGRQRKSIRLRNVASTLIEPPQLRGRTYFLNSKQR